jgi:hypothetical protein
MRLSRGRGLMRDHLSEPHLGGLFDD